MPESPIRRELPEGVEPEYGRAHPRVFHDREAIERTRRNAESGKAWVERVVEETVADVESRAVTGFTDAEIRAHAPDPGAYFSHGKTAILCPSCGTALDPIGWERPGKLVCGEGHVLPNEEYPDRGDGWTGESGETRYFLARWNGFVVDRFTRALEPLAHAHVLTGERAYADTAAAILDALATVYPTADDGPLNHPGIEPGGEDGRLERPGYQVARTLVRYVEAADLLWESDAFEGESPTNPEVSMRENVAVNMFVDGADFCERVGLEERGYGGYLHNGTADYVRGIAAVGSMLGVESYVEWLTDSTVSYEYFLANNVDRDATYYETASMYSDHARGLYRSFAELLYHLETDEHPDGINLYDDPRFRRLFVGADERRSIAGRRPRHGDSGPEPDTAIRSGSERGVDSAVEDPMEDLERTTWFYARTDDAERRRGYARRLAAATDGDPEAALDDPWHVMAVDGVDASEREAAGETGETGGTREADETRETDVTGRPKKRRKRRPTTRPPRAACRCPGSPTTRSCWAAPGWRSCGPTRAATRGGGPSSATDRRSLTGTPTNSG